MITSAKNYTNPPTKKNPKLKWTDRTLGQMIKAKLYRQNHTKKHPHTHSQKEKKGKKKYHCSQSPPPQFCDELLSIQVFHRRRVHQVDCLDLILSS